MRRKVQFDVVYSRNIGFCGEFRYDWLRSFDTYEEAEYFVLNGEADKYDVDAELQIHKIFKLVKDENETKP